VSALEVDGMRVQRGGAGEPVLLMIHGLGATSDVWRGVQRLLPERWAGRWLAPDLPGHGGSTALESYTFGTLARSMAELVDPADPVVVLGHSLGGVVGLELAGGDFEVDVAGVVGVGIKVSWAPEELAKAKALAERPVAWFDTRDEAADRFLRLSGLAGLIDPSDETIDEGLVESSGRWRLALDPRAFAVGAPDMPRLLARAKGPVVLARGEYDRLVTDEQLAALVAEPITLTGLGHNAQVERPEAVLGILDRIGF
jgi:pimeloyl-ACP methyl ester carboxylesterase